MTKKIVFALMFVCCMAFAGVSLAADAAEIKELEIKANQGDAEAQYALGVLYENGDGVEKNRTIAKLWYGKACDNGKFDGCRAAARLLSLGVK